MLKDQTMATRQFGLAGSDGPPEEPGQAEPLQIFIKK